MAIVASPAPLESGVDQEEQENDAVGAEHDGRVARSRGDHVLAASHPPQKARCVQDPDHAQDGSY